MTADELTQYNRGEFFSEAFQGVQDLRIDLMDAERLVRTAHFGIQLSQDPTTEHCYYSVLVEELCRSHRVDPEALETFMAFIARGPAPQTEDPFVYTLRDADTLSAVADRFHTTPEALLACNAFLQPPCFVSPGMRLQIPGSLTYVAGRPEPLAEAARHLTEYVQCFDPDAQITVEELTARNLLAGPTLSPGQAIAFPFSPFE